MNEFLRKSIKAYEYLGIWPVFGSSKYFEKLRKVAGIIVLISIAIHNSLQYADLFIQWGGRWESFLENAPLSILSTVIGFKAYVSFTRRDELVSLSVEIDSYVDELLLENNDEKIAILQGYQKTVQIINNFLWITAAISLTFMYTWTILTIFLAGDYSLRPMVVQLYIPFSLNPIGNYVTAFVLDLISGSLTGIYMITFDVFFIGCIMFTIARLKILQYSIQKVGTVVEKKMKDQSRNYFNFAGTLREIFQRNFGTELRRSVQEHKKIIALCKSIDSMLSLVLFAVFLSYSVILCFLGLYALRLGPSMNLFKLGQILLVLLSQIFLYFWYGNELMVESLKVANSALKNDWYNLGKRNITTIMIVAFRSETPIHLNVGKFNTVSLPTLISLLSTTYSYFALLKQFYQ